MSQSEFSMLQEGLVFVYSPVIIYLTGLFIAAGTFAALWSHVFQMLRHLAKRD